MGEEGSNWNDALAQLGDGAFVRGPSSRALCWMLSREKTMNGSIVNRFEMYPTVFLNEGGIRFHSSCSSKPQYCSEQRRSRRRMNSVLFSGKEVFLALSVSARYNILLTMLGQYLQCIAVCRRQYFVYSHTAKVSSFNNFLLKDEVSEVL